MKEDVIYRQNAIDVICLSWCGCQNSDCKHHFDPEVDESYWCDGCGDVEELKNIPSAQPERKPGRWEIRETADEDVEAKCPCCGFETLVNQPGNGLHMVNDLHFCPNCGEPMERGEEDE